MNNTDRAWMAVTRNILPAIYIALAVLALGLGPAVAKSASPSHAIRVDGPNPWQTFFPCGAINCTATMTMTGVPPGGFATETWLVIPPGIQLGPHGEVIVPSHLSLTRAAKLFWNAVARVRGQPLPFPEEKP